MNALKSKSSNAPLEAWVTIKKARGPEYRSWDAMKQRCNNPNAQGYHNYGGRGISVCAEWATFKNFFLDMGSKPTRQHTLERKNNSLGYFKANCVWATPSDQARNKRTNRALEVLGEKHVVTDWAKRIGIRPSSLHHRLNRLGWDIEKALTTPKLPLALGPQLEAKIVNGLKLGKSQRQVSEDCSVSRGIVRRIASTIKATPPQSSGVLKSF